MTIRTSPTLATLRGASAAVALGLAGLGTLAASPALAQEPATSPRAAEDALVMVARQDPGTLDYVKSILTALRLWIPANVVEPLVYFEADGTVSPGVAESWEISEDGTVYTFTIRDAQFSDGTPVTVEDVVYSLETMSESPVVANAAAFDSVTDITALDDRRVQVTLSQPSQNFWFGMGDVSGLIQPEAAAGDIATNPIGTGPYRLVEYVSNSHLTFEANPNYWGEAPAIEDVTVRIVTDGTAGLNALAAGEVDAIPVITIDLWEQLVNRDLDDQYELVTYPQVGEPTYAVINQALDPGLRQAIAMTLDRQQFNDAFGAAWGAENTCTFGLPNMPWYAPESAETCPYPFDFEAAMAAVAENGYGDVELEYVSLSDVPDLSLPADVMVPMMQAAGFDVTRNAIDLARYSQIIFQGRPPQFDVTIMSGPGGATQWACPDPEAAGWSTYCSAEYTEKLQAADAATSQEEYEARMDEASAILREDAVIVPLIAKLGVGLLHPDLEGFTEPRVGVAVELSRLSW
ncbi:putative ABC transporter substrate-binding protein [Oceanicola granulosus HTCC2516]|uniref:Putative ABC transporter substrate-binding protein n=1 Tax=Oceanicola granulosus (strain ATCC BAA-861 / DSM 15982 / KCTC 12143 / HTCC2516) TaxID=314256 RepID=Q2CJ59_OCEGH|nr:ABC transporter substrate-binding protein [Oceanicola granulosus]EAR52741.1 putative ABC transporter substrate-binding protein [Oceanicola granulosus HTCC2516]